jgi:hypothetical protein
MVSRPVPDEGVLVEYVDGSRKRVRPSRLAELSHRWHVVEEEDVQSEGQLAPQPEPPAKSASTDAWHQYALDRGASLEAIEGKTRTQLIAEYGPGDSDENGGDAGEE